MKTEYYTVQIGGIRREPPWDDSLGYAAGQTVRAIRTGRRSEASDNVVDFTAWKAAHAAAAAENQWEAEQAADPEVPRLQLLLEAIGTWMALGAGMALLAGILLL